MIAPFTCELGKTITLSGYANNLAGDLKYLEISFNQGKTWQEYELDVQDNGLNVYWEYEFKPTERGSYTFSVRSKDSLGNTGEEASAVNFDVV